MKSSFIAVNESFPSPLQCDSKRPTFWPFFGSKAIEASSGEKISFLSSLCQELDLKPMQPGWIHNALFPEKKRKSFAFFVASISSMQSMESWQPLFLSTMLRFWGSLSRICLTAGFKPNLMVCAGLHCISKVESRRCFASSAKEGLTHSPLFPERAFLTIACPPRIQLLS